MTVEISRGVGPCYMTSFDEPLQTCSLAVALHKAPVVGNEIA